MIPAYIFWLIWLFGVCCGAAATIGTATIIAQARSYPGPASTGETRED